MKPVSKLYKYLLMLLWNIYALILHSFLILDHLTISYSYLYPIVEDKSDKDKSAIEITFKNHTAWLFSSNTNVSESFQNVLHILIPKWTHWVPAHWIIYAVPNCPIFNNILKKKKHEFLKKHYERPFSILYKQWNA